MARPSALKNRLKTAVLAVGWAADAARSQRWARFGAVLGAVIALVIFAPASWLASAVSAATQDRVLLADAQGSIWNGNAVLVLAAGVGSRDALALPGRLGWTLRPSATPFGLRLTLNQDCCLPAGLALQLQPGWGRFRATLAQGNAQNNAQRGVDNAIAQWPAAWLVGLGTPWNTLQPGGALRLSTRDLALDWVQGRFVLSGSAELELRDFSSRLSTLPRLGSYRLQISTDAASGTPQVKLDTLDGALRLQGEGSWSASGLRLRGEASAAPDDQAALDNLLNIIGRRDGARSVLSIG